MSRASAKLVLIGLVGLLGSWGQALGQSWGNAQLLNDPGEGGADVKTVRMVAARNGNGFHAIYHVSNRIRYKRYANGVLGGAVTVFPGTNFMANGYLAEALNGDLHVAFEDWAGDSPEIRWYRSTNGGASWPSTQVLSNASGSAKHPHLAAYGATGSRMVMSYFRSGTTGGNNKYLWSDFFSGTAWQGEQNMDSRGNSEYEVFGMARSPADGSVYRSFTESGVLKMRRYNGQWWEQEIVLDSVNRGTGGGGAMHNRQRMAINDAGQVMVLWDQTDLYFSVLYTPGVGVEPAKTVTGNGSWGNSLCAIGGTTQFYTAYPADGANQVLGSRYLNGTWQGGERINNGQAWDFCVGPDVQCGPDGTLYCGWEFWGTGKPQQWFSIKPAPAPGVTGTIQGYVADQNGYAVPGAGVVSGNGGAAATSPNGYFSMVVPAGTTTLRAFKEHYAPSVQITASVLSGGTANYNLVITAGAPAPVSDVTVAAGNTQNQINWTNPGSPDFAGTMIRFRTDTFPTGPADGQLAVNDVAPPSTRRGFTHTGLTNGVTHYYRLFADATGGPSFAAPGIDGQGIPAVRADWDRDGDVDVDDFAHMQVCLTGPWVTQNDPQCRTTLLDGDDDVDQDDVARFIQCLTGPGGYANPECD